ncbi:MAG TPA: extracellular solute-binding protein [Chloroflexota bacterium]|nr:extracellular solute-binding protein [Chloroflexota bacterium]
MASTRRSRRFFLGQVGGVGATLVVGALLSACSGSSAPASPTAAAATSSGTTSAAAPTATTAATTAASTAAQPAATAAPSSKGKVELVAWAHWDQGIQWIIDAMKDYKFTDSNITIKKVVYPYDEVHAKMLAACVSGVGQPDIMRIEQGQMSKFLQGQPCFVDIKPLIGNKLNDVVQGSALGYWSWKGKVYGIGDEMNACAYAFRKAFLDQNKVDSTKLDSWDNIKAAGAALKEAKPGTSIIAWHDQSDGDFQTLLFGGGGQMFDENGEFGGDTDLGRKILTMMHDMLHKDKIAMAAPVTGSQTWSSPVYWEAFRKDQVATVIGPPWHIGNLGQDTAIGPTQSGQWYIQKLPTGFGANKPTATQGGTSMSIPTGSKYHDEAWSVIDFCNLTLAVLEDHNQRGILPTYIPALQDPSVQKKWDYYGGENTGALYLELAKEMPPIYQSPWAPQIHTAFQNDVITPYLQNPNATDADLNNMFAKLKTDIDKAKTQVQ